MDKKKRHNSGSRSKSRKSKPNDFSVDLKPNKLGYWRAFNQQSKTKTQSSIGKSKTSKKNSKSKRPLGPPIKRTNKDSKMMSHITQDISHSVSAQRKHSLTKINRTQANYFQQDFQRKIHRFKHRLSKLQRPNIMNPHKIMNFYKQIQKEIEKLQDPLHQIFSIVHQMYFQPFYALYQLISPYSDLINRKQEVQKQLQHMTKQVQDLRNGLDPQSLQILKLQEKIANNAQIIEQRNRMLKQSYKSSSNKGQSYQSQSSDRQYKNITKINDDNRYTKSFESEAVQNGHLNINGGNVKNIGSIGNVGNKNGINGQGFGLKGLRLNIDAMSKNPHQGFHDQFYSHLDEFSESWRNQAVRQKRF